MNKPLLKNRSAIIVFHEFTTGIGQDLRDYLLEKNVTKLLFISHPLLYMKDSFKKCSYYEWYEDGKLINKKIARNYVLPEQLLYLKDVFYTIFWIYKHNIQFDYYFGINNLNAIVGVLLRTFGKVHRTIYYVIDYVPHRFSKKILNNLYHWMDKISSQKSDAIWNLSPRMITAREEEWQKKFPNQYVVPHGVHFNRIKRLPFGKINSYEILYIGSLLKKQGIQLVIRVLPEVLKKVPEVRFTIVGKGPYEHELRNLAKKLKLDDYVSFLGYIESHQDLENRIAKAGVAVALYDKQEDEFTYYADPGKVKNYLGAGVPIIMTDVPYVAEEVKKAHCGFVIRYDKKELVDVLTRYFSDKNLVKRYKENAIAFAKKYEWSDIFTYAVSKLP